MIADPLLRVHFGPPSSPASLAVCECARTPRLPLLSKRNTTDTPVLDVCVPTNAHSDTAGGCGSINHVPFSDLNAFAMFVCWFKVT